MPITGRQASKNTEKFCILSPESCRITTMQKAEIKQIADYLKDLEEGLYEWDYRGITTQGGYPAGQDRSVGV